MLLRKIISVGIERILNCAPIAWCSSVLTFANKISGFRAAAAAKVGANARQGAHQGAQKSTTANGWSLIDGAKFSSVSSRTPGLFADMFVRPRGSEWEGWQRLPGPSLSNRAQSVGRARLLSAE